MFAEILAVEVAMRGIEPVRQGMDTIAQSCEAAEKSVAKLQTAMALLTAATFLVVAGVQQTMEGQRFQAMFEGLTGSAETAAEQMQIVDRIAAKGIFTETQAFKAIEAMNRFGVSVANNIDLIEKLGARSGNLESAANLISRIQTGDVSGLGQRLREFGIGPDKLKAAGLNVEGNNIKNSSQEIIAALEKIESSDKTMDKLMGTMSSQINRLTYQFTEMLDTIGAPFIGPLTTVLGIITEIFRWIKDLNIVTNGWVGNFLVGGLFIAGLVQIVGFLKEIALLEKLIALWAGIRNAMQAGPALLQGLSNVIKFLFSMKAIESVLLGIETARAFLAAAWAVAIGNIPGAIAAVALIAAAGVGAVAAVNAVNNYRNGQSSGDADGGVRPSGERPIRRDDWQRVYNRAYGEAWTG